MKKMTTIRKYAGVLYVVKDVGMLMRLFKSVGSCFVLLRSQ